MKVKVIKVSIEEVVNSINNSNLTEYLTLGNEYSVYGLSFSKGVTYIYIYNGNHLFEAPIQLFNIINNRIPNNWIIKHWGVGEITLWPELFYQTNFIENFAEREIEERKKFEELRCEIESN